MVPWNSGSLNNANFASYTLPPIHHFVEDFLLSWLCVRLVLLTNRCPVFARIVPHAKEIGPRVVAIVRLRVEGILILGCHVAAVAPLIWIHSL